MNKSNNITKMNVDRDFARWFKLKSYENGCSILEYSRQFAKKVSSDEKKTFQFRF